MKTIVVFCFACWGFVQSASALSIGPEIGYTRDFETHLNGYQVGGFITWFDADYEDIGSKTTVRFAKYDNNSTIQDYSSLSIISDAVTSFSLNKDDTLSIQPGIGVLINLFSFKYHDGSPTLQKTDLTGEIGLNSDIVLIYQPVKRFIVSLSPASMNYVIFGQDDNPRGGGFHLQYSANLSAGITF